MAKIAEKLTEAEIAALPPKAKRDPDVLQLYREHDYLTAYGLHTDRRVRTEGHEPAIGVDASRDNWDRHGDLQLDFLILRGLKPHHRLLDIGCGAGRLARKVVPYLEEGNYHGTDLSKQAIAAARDLSLAEGWSDSSPWFWCPDITGDLAEPFDFIWAHSVFTHLPPDKIEDVMCGAFRRLTRAGEFYWTYVPSETTERYGLTQFRATTDVYRACAERAGFTFEEIPEWVRAAGYEPGRWSYGQSVALSRRAS